MPVVPKNNRRGLAHPIGRSLNALKNELVNLIIDYKDWNVGGVKGLPWVVIVVTK